MSIQTITKLAFLAIYLFSIIKSSAARPDSSLWMNYNMREANAIYKGGDIRGVKAAGILSSSNPDKYFEKYNLKIKNVGNIGDEGYKIRVDSAEKVVEVTARTGKGLLYGALSLYRPGMCRDRIDIPANELRILNHWDNLDGNVERGYAGKSIWVWDKPLTAKDVKIYEKYALANASVGINGTVINNVNASPDILRKEKLERIAEIADILRPYGMKVFLSVNFASPSVLGGLKTSDPLDEEVALWWKNKVKEISSLIPDFGGFLVKANSEGQPGPCDYGRTHADGANMLARALSPSNGIVIWRAFVYNASDADRAKQAYNEFMPLDGKFDSNVLLQVKNGPVDFQPREPFSPLFGGMKKTPLLAELQITQEYLGHSNHLAYLAPMWREFFDEAPRERIAGVAGVANIGNDDNFTGHPLAQANWYSFGRLAWDPDLSPRDILKEWTEMTPWLYLNEDQYETFEALMLTSRETVVDYMMPMGLHHLFAFGHHYGPEPWCEVAGARPDWLPEYYHRADSEGIGFDRTAATGSGATLQYPYPLSSQLEDPDLCPEKYLLWFHHLGWDRKLKSGETTWDALNRHYDQGVAGVDNLRHLWRRLEGKVEPEIYQDISDRLLTQHKDAIWWRDACLEYFGHIASKKPEKNPMHKLSELKKIKLGINNYTSPSSQLLDSVR